MRWTWRDIVSVAVLPLIIFVALIIPAWVNARLNAQQVTISCVSAKANIQQLEALTDISQTLGLPTHFTVPPLPAECAGS